MPPPTPPPNPNPTPTPPPPPPSVQGLVTSPLNGELFQGTTTELVIPVSGTYTGTSNSVTIQILDPTQGNTWVTVGAASVQSGSFATEIGPFNTLQFPQGGLLAVQAIDGNGATLPYQLNNDTTYSNTTLIIGNPGLNPTDWNFLTQQPVGNASETQLYYQQIGAPQTLTDFENEFFPDGVDEGGAANALYVNKGDLGIGRSTSCNTTQTGGVACFVENFGDFEGNEDTQLDDIENPRDHRPNVTLAMVFNPPITNTNAVQFIAYDGNGNLADTAQLDQVGENTSVPQNCLNCHGGQATFNAGTFAVTGGQFLQLDPLAMDFNENDQRLTFAAQQTAFFQMEQLITEAQPTPTENTLIKGEWTEEGGTVLFNPSFVPGAWNTNQRDANLYQQVIAPFCRACHASDNDAAGLAFASPQDFTAKAAGIVNEVCGGGPNGMPVAEANSTRFFAGIAPGCNETDCVPNTVAGQVPMAARALVLEYLGQGSAAAQCAQGQVQ
jgi:hypothetical protein